MWKSLFDDLFQNLEGACRDNQEKAILGIHLFNIAKGYQCTGLLENDPRSESLIPDL